MCILYSHHILNIFHHTYRGMVALHIRTDFTNVRIRDIMTYRTIFHIMLQRNQRLAETLNRLYILPQQV